MSNPPAIRVFLGALFGGAVLEALAALGTRAGRSLPASLSEFPFLPRLGPDPELIWENGSNWLGSPMALLPDTAWKGCLGKEDV